MKRICFLLLAATLFAGCTAIDEDITRIEPTDETSAFDTLYASFDAATRVSLDASNHSSLLWNADDEIAVFLNNSATLHRYRATATDGQTATFDKVSNTTVASGNGTNTALYPYDSDANYVNNLMETKYKINTDWPTTQAYAAGGFDKASHLMVATSTKKEFAFKNVGGFLIIKLYGLSKVGSITLRGRNGERIRGRATVSIPKNLVGISGGSNDWVPSVSFAADDAMTDGDAITLDCGAEGVMIGTTANEATEFWFCLPPVTFTNGIEITITSADGHSAAKQTANSVAVERNKVTTMKALSFGNRITYTTSDDKPLTESQLQQATAYCGHYTHVYQNGSGSITFTRTITEIPKDAFASTKIASIVLPEEITSIENRAFQYAQLTSITIPDGVTSLGVNAFHKCPLKSITIPGSVTSIGAEAFNDCTSLASINIPSGVVNIGERAFAGCIYLDCIDCYPTTPPTIGVDAFLNIGSMTNDKGCNLRCPKDSNYTAWQGYFVMIFPTL